MKTKLIFFISILFCGTLFAQNITNTLGSTGTFSISDNTLTYLSLSQSNGTINLIGPLAGNQRGSILKGGNRFLHTYFGSGTDGFNTFLGINSGNFTLGGTGVQGSYNTGVGIQSLSSITTGSFNSALGYQTLYSNTTGSFNSALGYQTLYSNTTGSFNSGLGYQTLNNNTTGDSNTAYGKNSQSTNTTGKRNTSFGTNAQGEHNSSNNSVWGNSSSLMFGSCLFGIFPRTLYNRDNCIFGYHAFALNPVSDRNTAFGNYSLYNATQENTAFGYRSLYSSNVGGFNTAFGYDALMESYTGRYALGFGYKTYTDNIYYPVTYFRTAIGYEVRVIGSWDNVLVLGGLTYAGVQVPWTITSDRRNKENILPIRLGLDFISKLNPVSYVRKKDETGKTEYGLIAQEVEEVLKREGVDNFAMITVIGEGDYKMRYNDLIAPIIKAIQELDEKSEGEKEKILDLKKDNNEINALLSDINKKKELMQNLKDKISKSQQLLNKFKQLQKAGEEFLFYQNEENAE